MASKMASFPFGLSHCFLPLQTQMFNIPCRLCAALPPSPHLTNTKQLEYIRLNVSYLLQVLIFG